MNKGKKNLDQVINIKLKQYNEKKKLLNSTILL